MPVCPKCGHQNAEGSNFCAQCGEPLHRPSGETTRVFGAVEDNTLLNELSSDDVAAVDALPEASALLIVQRGPDTGARYLLDSDEATAGRHPQSEIFLNDVTVSRHHAKFSRRAGQFFVRDLGSLNGTYVNRRLLDGESGLRLGDEVQIGKYRMVFFVHGTA